VHIAFASSKEEETNEGLVRSHINFKEYSLKDFCKANCSIRGKFNSIMTLLTHVQPQTIRGIVEKHVLDPWWTPENQIRASAVSNDSFAQVQATGLVSQPPAFPSPISSHQKVSLSVSENNNFRANGLKSYGLPMVEEIFGVQLGEDNAQWCLSIFCT
jgi:hypothetical protein